MESALSLPAEGSRGSGRLACFPTGTVGASSLSSRLQAGGLACARPRRIRTGGLVCALCLFPGPRKQEQLIPELTASLCSWHFDRGPKLEQTLTSFRTATWCSRQARSRQGLGQLLFQSGKHFDFCIFPPQGLSTSMKSTACKHGSSRTFSGLQTLTSCPGSLPPSSSTTGYHCCGAPTSSAMLFPPSP